MKTQNEIDAGAVASDLLAISKLKDYLNNIITSILENDAKITDESENMQSITRFCSSQDITLLFLSISSSEQDKVVITHDGNQLSAQTDGSIVAFSKHSPSPLTSDKSISSQLQMITLGVDGSTGDRRLLFSLQQCARNIFNPVARIASQSQQSTGSSSIGQPVDLEAENVELLQKKLRELDVVLEQCQRGAIIPSAHLPYHPALDVPTSRANATTIKGHLEKYNVSQVDQYLTDLGLTTVIGSTAESREEFANELNKYAKSWPIEISKQTKLAESSFPGSIEKEIGFWKEMEKKLAETRENLDSVPIALTKLILRRTNRVSEQLIREAEIDLDKCHEIVQTSVQFVRDFPIDDVLSASDLHPKLSKAVNTGLQHFAKLKHSKYDFNRALQVLEVFCAAIFTRMVALLKEKNMLLCDMDELCRIKRQTDEVLIIWETQLITQRSMLKDVAKRRNEKMRPLNLQYESLQQRLNAVFQFRENHQRLVNVFTEVLSGQESDLTAELNEAYRIVLRVENDLFDVSTAGASAWLSALDLYERRLERVESRVTRLLEGRLNNCKTAEDMFRVFAIFNPLFFRPAIRNAVNSFRTLLVKNVREDVHRLQNKFRLRYDDSLEKTTADLRDIPPLSGQIIWAKQIDNQLSTLMQRMADVLGADWGDHFEGKQLKEVCEELKSYLTTDQLYSEWLSQQLAKSDTNKFSKSRDFLLLVETDPKTNHKVLVVNFDQKQVTVFKEVRYLEWLLPTMNTAHKTIPHTVRNQAKEAFTRYPVAMALQAALSGYAHAKSGINATNQSLLVNHLQAVREAVKEAIGGNKRSKRWIKWDSVELNEWVSQLSSKVYTLQERVDDLNEKLQSTDHLLSQLYSCPYDRKTMDGIIEKMQIIVDEMQTRGFSNILVWVNDLDKRTESVILSRLKAAIQLWSRSFLHNSTSFAVAADSTDSHVDGADAVVEEVLLPLDQTVYEILLSNQILYLSPPLDQARVEWISSFHQFIGIAASLSRIVSSRLHVFAKTSTGPKDFSDVLQQVDSTIMRSAFDAIEVRIQQAYEYVAQWLQYQTLWDASVSEIADRLGREIPKWCQLLSDIKASRATIETADDEKSFGPLVINHRQVQNKVNLKYDTWQKDSQQRFGAILSEEIRALYSELSTCKSKLEAIYLEGPTKDVISGVEYILKTKSTITAKKEQVELLENSEKVLQRQRFQFPKEWLAATTLVSAFTDMSQILDKRSSSMDMQLPTLQIKIKEEDRLLLSRTDELSSNWERDRPADGNAVPSEVLQSLSMFASQVSKLYEDATRLQGAKKALGMDFLNDNRLGFITQEVADLREAWGSVTPFHDKLRDIRTVLLRDSNPIKVRKQLEEILNELRNLPAKIRSYSPIECLQDRIGKYMNIQPVLRDVCTEALKDRHWKVILQGLGIHTLFSELNLGSFWDANPLPHRKLITDVLGTAQGELALEQFLRDLREFWLGCELTLVMRDNIRLVTGWDVLFSTLEDNLNSLAALKQSPYFRNVPEFQEDTMSWEGRLTSLRVIFDFWVEVQRKWVYLRGIFRNPDIKAQLPAQYSKFKSIDSEFIGLLKRIATKPSVMELLQIDNLSRQLERQDAGMIVIQKALGDYLEKQRQIFPRFYFVNNDDLVEIIGNVNEPGKIVPHLSKMFSAINSLEFHTDGGDVVSSSTSDDSVALTKQSVVAMCSKEGERVALTTSISLAQGIKEWLGQLERGMVVTLATLLQKASASASEIKDSELLGWMSEYPNQVVILAMQVLWTRNCENALKSKSSAIEELKTLLAALDSRLKSLSESVLGSMEASLRKKCEHLLTEMVHQRDVVRQLIAGKVTSNQDFKWLYHLRFYLDTKEVEPTKQLTVCMSNASFFYGFEYLGIGDRLVQTPLTDRCYLTLTQALHFRMGGNPFGPAGTGKTESVKMLGAQLGRFVLVFNCDSSFDYAAMGRIFAGLCQVGAFGCFDEFNRLEERILSAVSQQILTIQKGLLAQKDQIELLGNPCKLHKDVGIFVTMNPGYAGRSNLPDNLKRLFRAVAMTVPNRKMITQVMLFSQGIVTVDELAGKITLLFTLCEEQLSVQSHYDFGLRALRAVLTGAGELKRKAILKSNDDDDKTSQSNMSEKSMEQIEMDVLIKSTCDSVLPKLVAEDIPLFTSLLKAVFPKAVIPIADDKLLLDAIQKVCEEDSLEFSDKWAEKVLQLSQVLEMRHGVMLVGPCGTGKSTAWRTLFKALARVDGSKGDNYIIDPKSIKKEKLYGSLDPNTLEWIDGIFTKTLRRVIETNNANVRAAPKRCWIVFDGDVDPEWAENLNSVLDDNKILTLPSGDRLKIPDNVRIMMEVDTLANATLATVSRCGMVWFASDTVSTGIALLHHIKSLRKDPVHSLDATSFGGMMTKMQKDTQEKFVDAIAIHFTTTPGLVSTTLAFSMSQPAHIMEPSMGRLLGTLDSFLSRGIALAIEYNENNSTFPMSDHHMEQFANKWLMYSLLWAFGGSLPTDRRIALGDLIASHSTHGYEKGKSKGSDLNLLDLSVNVNDGSWQEWSLQVPKMEIESHKVKSSDVVIATADTVRHAEIMRAWLSSHKPLLLCGPPGSGKTMTLTSVLESMPEYILAALNFSSTAAPELILKTFAQYCEVVDSPDGLVMQPNHNSYRDNQWLVVFCDEINLPSPDKYGTQRVIMFLRQLVERNGYWNSDCRWVSLKRIQFVGACNPPTDAGRVPLSQRFLRHTPLLLVDYPTEPSLKQIYRCFNQALLKIHPNLRGAVDSLNNAMVHFYLLNQQRFTQDVAPQYIYSPRELSRWVRAMYEAMEPLEAMTMEELVRLWGHEALRLFHDRLITAEEKAWCEQTIDEVAKEYFAGVDTAVCLQRPILYSNWLKKTYQSTDRDTLRNFIAARLKVFYEEELDVPLVIFDDVLEHVLRIDNVLRHPMGHLLLVGESGVGKTVLSRFVSWMNGLKIFQIKASSKYTIENFDEDLRILLRRVGVEGESISFIFDESNVLSSAFLERMNALLASGEVPGLFEGDDRVQLLSALRDSVGLREGAALDADDELWRRFTRVVQKNLHVIFTMNPASSDFQNRCTTSPALFNRCVVDWFGTWSPTALAQVGHEFTLTLDTGFTDYAVPTKSLSGAVGSPATNALQLLYLVTELTNDSSASKSTSPTLRDAVVAALVSMHNSVKELTLRLGKGTGRQHYLSPRDFLELIRKFIRTEQEKRSLLEEQQTHIRTGLDKLLETQSQVATLRHEMVAKEEVLKFKDTEANAKLTQMVEKQNEAEQQKSVAEKLTKELHIQNEQIRVRKESVEQELSEAEPALISAKQSVSNIKKAQLDEVRALTRPPQAVMVTMEMVCVMIGESNLDWNEIRKIIRRDDFISTVVNFDPISLSPKQVKQVTDDYLSNTDINFASVDRASKACGPLFQWAESQIKYATILRRIKPLRDEVAALQIQSDALLLQQQQAVSQVEELEAAIKSYKAEYAAAIRDAEKIQTEMDVVSKKVSRAESLLLSLNEEKDRWQGTSASFDLQMSTLIGDSLLAAAFLTYDGIFDHKARRSLQIEWSETLENLGVPFRSDLNMIGYLSTPSDQMRWKGLGLMTDDLAVENAILLDKFDRYPLVIDPSGQAVNFLLKKYASQNIAQTSFLDASFMKTLASSIRFGKPLLVNDVESVDPILNPLLNKELQRTGGRTLIRLGNEEIDFSPKFFIILTTRNPQAHFSPDLCSRVTMVNFTVTPASLEAQALSAVLKAERPDVDDRRTEALRLQGEQNVKLRELEELLLNRISAVQGAILDDDSVIRALEQIKSEAADLQKELAKTQDVMTEIQTVSAYYEPLASIMSQVYFALEGLAEISPLYQFSLQMFLETVFRVLKAKSSAATTVADNKATVARVRTLIFSFAQDISARVLRSLRLDDKVLFLVRLGQIVTAGDSEKELSVGELDLLYKGSGALFQLDNANQAKLLKLKDCIPRRKLDDATARQLFALTQQPVFANLSAAMNSTDIATINEILDGSTPELSIPASWLSSSPLTDERSALLRVLIVRALRSERSIPALEEFINTIFGPHFAWREFCRPDLRDVIESDTKASRPVMICSEPGQDASSKVDTLAGLLHKPILQVAMGSTEGVVDADRSIAQAVKSGSWVLLRNVHLCIEWLTLLEKRLSTLTPHQDFRLFLTCEIHPALPTALIRVSDVIVMEASTGIKANMLRFYNTIPKARIDRAPAERCRLYSLLTWLNAVVQERKRYTPLGWTKKYEFSESDALCALDVIDEWLDGISVGADGKSRAHVDPSSIPWEAFRTLLSQSLYGGRVDDPFDQAALNSFVESLFSSASYSASAVLAKDTSGQALLTLPDTLGRAAFEEWLRNLPDANPPTWIGLPATSESQLMRQRGQSVLSKLTSLQDATGEWQQIAAAATSKSQQTQSDELGGTVDTWLQALRSNGNTSLSAPVDPRRLASTDMSAVERSLVREVEKGTRLQELLHKDLELLKLFSKGATKATNEVRELVRCVKRDLIPTHWRAECSVPQDLPLSTFLRDIAFRVRVLDSYFPFLSNATGAMTIASSKLVFALGNMFLPETFITGLRQVAAQVHGWSLEELELVLDINCTTSRAPTDALVEGLCLEGAEYSGNGSLVLSELLSCLLPPSRLSWHKSTSTGSGGTTSLVLPLYRDQTRMTLVCNLVISNPYSNKSTGGDLSESWTQRSVAVVMKSYGL